jgi:hypothetical protein
VQGMSERDYAARAGVSRGAIQKAKTAGRLVLHPDGSIDADASDARRAAATDPSKQRGARASEQAPRASAATLKPVPTAAVAAMSDTLREHGLPPPAAGGATFLQAKTANEVLQSQERRLKLQKLKGELVDRARAEALVFRLARETRDAWVNWPARAAALIAAEVGIEPARATWPASATPTAPRTSSPSVATPSRACSPAPSRTTSSAGSSSEAPGPCFSESSRRTTGADRCPRLERQARSARALLNRRSRAGRR